VPIPTRELDAHEPGTAAGQFPCSLLIACRRRHLTLFPRYRRDYAAGLHHGLPAKVKIPAQEFPASPENGYASQPAIRQVSAGDYLGNVTRQFLAYTSSMSM